MFQHVHKLSRVVVAQQIVANYCTTYAVNLKWVTGSRIIVILGNQWLIQWINDSKNKLSSH